MINKVNFRNWYDQYIGKIIPRYALLSLAACFAANGIIYWGIQFFMKNAFHYDFTSSFDRNVPFMKEWVVIYLVCYIFWLGNYIVITHEGKERWFRFVTADIVAKLICGVFFIFLPTTNIRPEVLGTDIFSDLMRFVYNSDPPINLFPSMHCLISWFCYLGLRNSKTVSTPYKWFSFIFAVLVFASTQFTKQHYWIDILGGLVIAEIGFYYANHSNLYQHFQKFFERLNQLLFGSVSYDK